MADVRIAEEFDHPQGRWENDYAYGGNHQLALADQRHTDIRVFQSDPLTTRPIMIYFNMFTMDGIDPFTMADLEDQVAIRRGEEWTVGTVEKATDRNYWKNLSLTCPGGTLTVTESVISKSF
jgi:hypothetical protein